MIVKRDDAFKYICQIRSEDVTGCKIGTGMFVSSKKADNSYYGWIVTASHVAKETNENTKIIISMSDGKAKSIPLTLFGQLTHWIHHKIADVSVFWIEFSDRNLEFMNDRFFPYDHFNLTKSSVSRDFELTSIGFPNGLGVNGYFSPLSFRSYASSGFLTLPRADTGNLSVFFCLENPSCGGYSGCPIFDLGYSNNGVMSIVKAKTICHGIMHGTMSDDTGGKIALVTPSYYLSDLIIGN